MLKDVYDDYMKEAIANYSEPQFVNVKSLGIGNNILVDPEILISELQQIDSKSDEELYEFIKLAYAIMLDVEFLNKANHKVEIAKSFMNLRFVMTFCTVISSVQLTEIQQICCNKLIYDYFTLSSNKNEQIIQALYNMGWNVNKNHMAGLYGKGLDQKLMTYVVVARFSTTDVSLATKRVNTILMNQPVSIMTEQVIVNIYEQLFSQYLMSLFNGIMFDTFDFEDDMCQLDESQEEIYDTINLALLDIINQIPMNMLVQLLRSYSQTKQFCHPNDPVRFDIHSISGDYERVLIAIGMVEAEGIIIPHK